MTIERSHGKARPTLPRSSDLTPEPSATDCERSGDRDAAGRATFGNRLALGRGWKSRIREGIERAGASSEESKTVVADTKNVYMAIVRELPRAGVLARMTAASAAREYAFSGFYDAKALEAGLATDEGQKLAAKAGYHRQRFERLAVTTRDLARVGTSKTSRRRSAATTIRAELAREAADAD